VVAITCVVWSLYVLIDRTAEEIKLGELQWPFWTKLVVVAIGFTGGLVFMYIQCKVYVHLCRKWKAYNRIIVVQDSPEGVLKQKAAMAAARSNETARRKESSVSASIASPEPSSSTAANKTNAETQTALKGISLRIRASSSASEGESTSTERDSAFLAACVAAKENGAEATLPSAVFVVENEKEEAEVARTKEEDESAPEQSGLPAEAEPATSKDS
jgi:hypothetical protein